MEGATRKATLGKVGRKKSGFLKSGFRPSVFQVPGKTGFLEKKSTGLVKRRIRRYFEIAGHYLRYYDSDKNTDSESSLKGAVNLFNVRAINCTLMTEGQFELLTNAEENVSLKADSPEEAELWVAAIESYINFTR